MCYSKSSSLGVFLTSFAAITYLWRRNFKNDRFFAVISFSIVAMQLVEYFMWSDQRCGMINHYATLVGGFLILLQPLTGLLAARLFSVTLVPQKVLSIAISVYSLGIFAYLILIASQPLRLLCSRPIAAPHLVWDFPYLNDDFVSRVLYFAPITLLLFMKDRLYGVCMWLILMLMLSMTLRKSSVVTNPNFSGWQSLWCLISNALPFAAIFIGYTRNR